MHLESNFSKETITAYAESILSKTIDENNYHLVFCSQIINYLFNEHSENTITTANIAAPQLKKIFTSAAMESNWNPYDIFNCFQFSDFNNHRIIKSIDFDIISNQFSNAFTCGNRSNIFYNILKYEFTLAFNTYKFPWLLASLKGEKSNSLSGYNFIICSPERKI